MPFAPNFFPHAAFLAGATCLAWVSVGLCHRLAYKAHLMDNPNERSLHSFPKPRIGGIGIVFTVLLGVLIISLISDLRLLAFLAVALVVALVSLVDDLKTIPFWMRLPAHLGAGVALVLLGGALPYIAWPGLFSFILPTALASLLCIFWVGGMINAYNFMDGSDGIAGLQGALFGLGLMLFSHALYGQLLGAVIVGACCGFLIHNWQPSKIFMGDVGSAFLGCLVAAAPWLMMPQGDTHSLWDGFVLTLLLVWPFFLDTAFTFTRRLLKRENVFAAHRSHLYQRLVLSGWSHARVAILYGFLASLGILLGLLWKASPHSGWIIPITLALCFSFLYATVLFSERRAIKLAKAKVLP